MTNQTHLEDVDFGLQELPGDSLHRTLRALRERGEVEPTRFLGQPALVITRHEALEEAFLDEHVFPGHRMYQVSFEPAIGKSFISDPDPASHLLFRKLATPAFRSRAVASYEQSGLASLANELVDRIGERDEFDLVKDFAARFPYLVISRLLGLPRDREDEFHAWAIALFNFSQDPANAVAARKSLSELIVPILEERRRAPRNDEAWQTFCRQPEKIPAAVNEGLRWDTPIASTSIASSHPISYSGGKRRAAPDCISPAATWRSPSRS